MAVKTRSRGSSRTCLHAVPNSHVRPPSQQQGDISKTRENLPRHGCLLRSKGLLIKTKPNRKGLSAPLPLPRPSVRTVSVSHTKQTEDGAQLMGHNRKATSFVPLRPRGGSSGSPKASPGTRSLKVARHSAVQAGACQVHAESSPVLGASFTGKTPAPGGLLPGGGVAGQFLLCPSVTSSLTGELLFLSLSGCRRGAGKNSKGTSDVLT